VTVGRVVGVGAGPPVADARDAPEAAVLEGAAGRERGRRRARGRRRGCGRDRLGLALVRALRLCDRVVDGSEESIGHARAEQAALGLSIAERTAAAVEASKVPLARRRLRRRRPCSVRRACRSSLCGSREGARTSRRRRVRIGVRSSPSERSYAIPREKLAHQSAREYDDRLWIPRASRSWRSGSRSRPRWRSWSGAEARPGRLRS